MKEFIDHIKERIIKKEDDCSIKLCEEVTQCKFCIYFLEENRRQNVLDWYITNNNFGNIDTIQLSIDFSIEPFSSICDFDDFYEIIDKILNKLLKTKITYYSLKPFLVLFDLTFNEEKRGYNIEVQIMLPSTSKQVKINKSNLKGMPHFINIVQLDLDVFNNIEKYVKNIDKKTIENFFDITDCHFGIKTEIMKYIFLWGVFKMDLKNNKIICDNWELNKNHLGYESK